jgi:hypothetical protein
LQKPVILQPCKIARTNYFATLQNCPYALITHGAKSAGFGITKQNDRFCVTPNQITQIQEVLMNKINQKPKAWAGECLCKHRLFVPKTPCLSGTGPEPLCRLPREVAP